MIHVTKYFDKIMYDIYSNKLAHIVFCMASRWRVWDNEAHINISGRAGSGMSWPVKHTVGRGNLHKLAERVSLPQLDSVVRSPGSRSKPPPRGMGRADLLRNRLSRQNEAKRVGFKVSYKLF